MIFLSFFECFLEFRPKVGTERCDNFKNIAVFVPNTLVERKICFSVFLACAHIRCRTR